MILRQFFDDITHSFSYLIACEKSSEAIMIDPVENQIPLITQVLQEFKFNLVKTLETHVHADHVTASGKLRELFHSDSYNAKQANVICASQTFEDGDIIKVGELSIEAISTPGHTDDSFCFLLKNNDEHYLFTGDTLLIRGTGRTDFQNGDAASLYNSLQKILNLPDKTIVYPGHDYHGRNISTIAEEKIHNPRIANKNLKSFVEMMNNLKLPKPKFIDIAVPANKACGKIIMEAGK